MTKTRIRKPDIESAIQDRLGAGVSFGVGDIVAETGTSRQAVHRHVARLVDAQRLVRDGRGRATRYRRAGAGLATTTYECKHATTGLAEDAVWRELASTLPELARPECANLESILAYSLTEMVNNAIDHSGSPELLVRGGRLAGHLWFEVRDWGIGAFENVRAMLALSDHFAAAEQIAKGKTTTIPSRHTGEGLFFTSKLADRFELAANGLAWHVDNVREDEALGVGQNESGTFVRFEVALGKSTTVEQVFARFTHDFEFDTTRTVVKLYEHGVRFVARSEAKRLLRGLERFRFVLVDFRGVEAVGQGFADEVFRVWARAHPDVELTAEHMASPVAFMVERARRSGGSGLRPPHSSPAGGQPVGGGNNPDADDIGADEH